MDLQQKFSRFLNSNQNSIQKLNYLIYDPGLSDVNTLLNSVDSSYILLPVNSTSKFIDIVSKNLVKKDIDKIAILAHGEQGKLELGSEIINIDYLIKNSSVFSQIKVSEISLYSCFVGRDLTFIDTLQNLTNAKIYSSTSKVGFSNSKYNWTLTCSADNTFNNVVPFSRKSLKLWNHSLNLSLFAAEVDTFLADQ